MLTGPYKPNPVVGTNAGFNTGVDLLDGALDAYFRFENQKLGLELQHAEVQQRRLHDAVNVDQQINEKLYASQGRDGAGAGNASGALFVAAAVAALFLLK